MPEATITRSAKRLVTVAHVDGHEFEFGIGNTSATKLYFERWKNKRLPLNAVLCREAARRAAEQCFRENGLIQ